MTRPVIHGNFNLESPLTRVPPKRRGAKRVWYVPNHRSFGAFMRSEQMRSVTYEVSLDIAALAKDFSPVSQRGGNQDGERMRDQFRVLRNVGNMNVGGNWRVMVWVVNDARSAGPNEFGTRNNARHRMLGRAGAAFGDFKPEGGPGGTT